jgi:hypothetical protein
MFNSVEYISAWNEWKQHYEEKTNCKYSSVSERKAQAALYIKSHGIEKLAIDSINWSIEKNWGAIYIKPSNNGTDTEAGKQSIREDVKSEFAKRYSGQ